MSFPPALTWLELLPKQTCCACESGPGWLRALVAEHVPRRRDANECDALALVNSSDVPAGYEYVRHLGVLPKLDNPRWFVPLDSGARAAAGLSLYTPART